MVRIASKLAPYVQNGSHIDEHGQLASSAVPWAVRVQCCGSEKIFFGFRFKIILFGFGYGFSFYTSIKGNIKLRQSVFHEDVLIKFNFFPA
jgi:hypothetical protein